LLLNYYKVILIKFEIKKKTLNKILFVEIYTDKKDICFEENTHNIVTF